jgi:hypothetical protein
MAFSAEGRHGLDSRHGVIQSIYWRAFNVLAWVVASLFLAAGVFGVLSALIAWQEGDSVVTLCVSGLIAVAGFFMLRAKAYRPDLDGYDSAFRETNVQGRSWWTGVFEEVIPTEDAQGNPINRGN